MRFSEAFSGLTLKSVIGLLIVAAGILVLGKPILHLLSQVLDLAANAIPAVGK